MSQFERSERLLGIGSTEILKQKKVIVFGAGGVGSYVLEGLIRSGIGSITVVDSDTVAVSNLNRQLIATRDTVGMDKVTAVKERLLKINPDAQVTAVKEFLLPENISQFGLENYSYIVDAIDTVSSKIALAVFAYENGIPIISSMGTGNKLDPTRFRVADIYSTSMCPLARVMRYELKKRGIKKLKVVFSQEEPIKGYTSDEEKENRHMPPGSVPFVPSVAGLIIAGEVIKDLLK